MAFQAQKAVPTVNFSLKNLKPGTSSWISTSNEVMQALEEYGCFVAVYDNISTELYKNVACSIKQVFDLPLESKLKNVSHLPYFGYVGEGPTRPLFESLGFVDSASVDAIAKTTKTMFPSGNQHLRCCIHSYSSNTSYRLV